MTEHTVIIKFQKDGDLLTHIELEDHSDMLPHKLARFLRAIAEDVVPMAQRGDFFYRE